MKISSGMRSPRFLDPFWNFDAGKILPRALPVMSGTRHSTSSMALLERNFSKLVKGMIDLDTVDRRNGNPSAHCSPPAGWRRRAKTMDYGRPSRLDGQTSYRAPPTPYPDLPPLLGEAQADVAVIGAGLTGLSAALEL